MADKILQIDGAQDSSSDSDAEVALKAKAGNCVLDREHNADLMRCHQSISNESLSNILSVLNDNSTASLPVIVSQTPPTFWSNFSPRMDCSWLPPSQETWSWDKNEVTFTDCFPSRSQAVGLCDFPVAFASKPLEDVNFSESLGNLFASNQFFDNYNSVSTLSPCSNIESNYSNSSLGIPTPSSRFDNYSDINMNLINETSHEIIQSFSDLKGSENQTTTQVKPVKGENTVSPAANVEKKQKTINIKEKILNNAKEVNKKLISDVKQTKTVSLTLKQYLKDFGEIVNVDLKNFSDREMVVVEYKPLHVKSSRSKFLIKPLDKFLENWNIAEKKINDELKEGKKISNAWQITMNQSVVESAKKKMDTEENNLNLLSVDSLESKQKSDRLKASKFKTVNNNVFKSKEITSENNEILKACNKKIQECAKDFTGEKLSIKVKKSRIKNFEESITEESHYVKQAATANNITKNSENDPNANNPLLCRSKNFRKNKLNGTTKANNKKYFKTRDGKNKSDRLSLNNLNENSVQGKKKEMNSRNKTLRNSAGTEGKINSSNIDFKLINQINSCFEDYFKNIVKVNNSCGENVNNFRQNSSEPLLKKNTDGYENHKTSASAQENSNFRKPCDSQSLESVKFVTQLLSIFSQMSKTCEIPPLSITINIGNRSDSESVPVQLNLQNSVNEKVGKGLKGKHKKLKRKLIIPNVDGAADNSSSEDSLENFSDCHPKISKKKIKKDSYYKALNVVLQKSATKEKKELTRKRKLSSTSRMDDNNDIPSDRGKQIYYLLIKMDPQV